MNSILKFLL